MATTVVGQRLSRVDARRKVTGAATYSAEHRIEGLLYGVIVNGTVARGTVSRISVDAALAHPGVLHVLTDFGSLRLAHPVDRIAFYGQPIAVVVAETLEAATHGASLVEATYERQDAVTDLDAPDIPSQTPADEPDYSRGDPAGALASAQVKVDLELTSARENHNPIELPSTIARWQDGRLTLWDKTQWSQGAARTVAGALGIAVGDVRVHNEFLGGGFGSGIQTYDHVMLAAFAAREVGKPVKVVLTRRQFYYGTGFRPASRHRISLGSSTAGRVSALAYDVRIENARYQSYTDGLTDLPQFLYGVPNTRTAYRVTPVDVHSPCSMRGPGVVLGNFALETAMDQLAHELAVDPVELRLRNEPTQDEVNQIPFSTRKLRECYETGARRFGWSRRQPSRVRARTATCSSAWGWPPRATTTTDATAAHGPGSTPTAPPKSSRPPRTWAPAPPPRSCRSPRTPWGCPPRRSPSGWATPATPPRPCTRRPPPWRAWARPRTPPATR
jgi:xanthine dehydrogenase YagR molybdenum-binding subunit